MPKQMCIHLRLCTKLLLPGRSPCASSATNSTPARTYDTGKLTDQPPPMNREGNAISNSSPGYSTSTLRTDVPITAPDVARRPLQAVPAEVIQIHAEAFAEEQKDVDHHGGEEDTGQEIHECGIEADQEEHQDAAEDGGGGKGDAEQAGELVRQVVVLLILGSGAQDFNDEDEQRHADHEGAEHQVQLRDHPHRHTAPDDREIAVNHVFLGRQLDFHGLDDFGADAEQQQTHKEHQSQGAALGRLLLRVVDSGTSHSLTSPFRRQHRGVASRRCILASRRLIG